MTTAAPKTKAEATAPQPITPEATEALANQQATIEQLQAQVAELLTRKDVTTAAPAKAPEPAPLPTRKLLFICEDDLVASEVHGPMYGCAKGGTPVIFKGDHADRRPHAMVHQSFGDFLIDTDRPLNARGGYATGPRYAWAEEG